MGAVYRVRVSFTEAAVSVSTSKEIERQEGSTDGYFGGRNKAEYVLEDHICVLNHVLKRSGAISRADLTRRDPLEDEPAAVRDGTGRINLFDIPTLGASRYI
ncbi:hypothetical protein F2Q68_00017287 [Brassica cretica]|uniref:Uncharacterized protein n=1 Tax=Brassica cretica TaxID=69181 RepID=A0A8S9HI27_BRACR|nr:hypothetical protein F2Q68_00017287 [Brassica cretica]